MTAVRTPSFGDAFMSLPPATRVRTARIASCAVERAPMYTRRIPRVSLHVVPTCHTSRATRSIREVSAPSFKNAFIHAPLSPPEVHSA